jgi:hypothetical protein
MVVVDVYFKGGTADELLGALREWALMVVGNSCVEGSQDWVVRPISAVVAGVSLARS